MPLSLDKFINAANQGYVPGAQGPQPNYRLRLGNAEVHRLGRFGQALTLLPFMHRKTIAAFLDALKDRFGGDIADTAKQTLGKAHYLTQDRVRRIVAIASGLEALDRFNEGQAPVGVAPAPSGNDSMRAAVADWLRDHPVFPPLGKEESRCLCARMSGHLERRIQETPENASTAAVFGQMVREGAIPMLAQAEATARTRCSSKQLAGNFAHRGFAVSDQDIAALSARMTKLVRGEALRAALDNRDDDSEHVARRTFESYAECLTLLHVSGIDAQAQAMMRAHLFSQAAEDAFLHGAAPRTSLPGLIHTSVLQGQIDAYKARVEAIERSGLPPERRQRLRERLLSFSPADGALQLPSQQELQARIAKAQQQETARQVRAANAELARRLSEPEQLLPLLAGELKKHGKLRLTTDPAGRPGLLVPYPRPRLLATLAHIKDQVKDQVSRLFRSAPLAPLPRDEKNPEFPCPLSEAALSALAATCQAEMANAAAGNRDFPLPEDAAKTIRQNVVRRWAATLADTREIASPLLRAHWMTRCMTSDRMASPEYIQHFADHPAALTPCLSPLTAASCDAFGLWQGATTLRSALEAHVDRTMNRLRISGPQQGRLIMGDLIASGVDTARLSQTESERLYRVTDDERGQAVKALCHAKGAHDTLSVLEMLHRTLALQLNIPPATAQAAFDDYPKTNPGQALPPGAQALNGKIEARERQLRLEASPLPPPTDSAAPLKNIPRAW